MDNVTEFYDSKDGYVAGIKGIMAPRIGEKINIRKVDYEVVLVDWAVDYAGEPSKRGRCNVHLKKL